ncbi:hypothetical protein [uncultured Stenotrophomonas sp.]|uniref:hypothetical protein n=1 Tax=uncultured Stenotrophomonas sp. TaxID=165438 RepID=UPI00258B814C|nr:hypothetical protein [uncultured Stenotrophomonas sp.]
MIENTAISGKLAVAVTTDGEPCFIGEVEGRIEEPCYLIRHDGRQQAWIQRLTREATAEETIDYWKQRALRAEKETDDGR